MARSHVVQRRGAGTAAVLRLVASRLARRRGAAALVALAVAGAIVVVGSLFGVGVVTADQATRHALAELPQRERAVAVNRYSDGALDDKEADAAVRSALGLLGATAGPVLDAISFQPPIGSATYFALDDVASLAVVTEGRLPAPCDGGPACEGIRISSFEFDGVGAVGSTANVGDIAVTIVGTADLAPGLPIDPLASFGVVILVDGVAQLAASAGLADVPRTRFWIAPLDPGATHSWLLRDLRAAIDGVERELVGANVAYVVNAPDEAFVAVQERSATAAGRLVFIASLIVAVLLAFAVFAAAIEREDIGLEYRRLRIHGARRGQLLAFILAEAAIPAVIGAVLGWLVAIGLVVAIGLTQGASPLAILRVSLLEPGALAVIGAIALLSAIAVGLGIHPASGRLIQPRLIAAAVVPAGLVLAWDRVSRGSVDAAELASQAAGPGTVLFPGLVGLTIILGSLVALPPVFRRLARAARGSPLPVRLSLVSLAREPLRPAATMTLLAFSVGAAVFALGHSATLTQGAADEAAFVAGMDIRVTTLGPAGDFSDSVLPTIADRTVLEQDPLEGALDVQPILHLQTVTASGRFVTLLGIDAAAIPALRGWRPDFSDQSPAALAGALAMPADWAAPGVELPVAAREFVVSIDSSGDPVRLSALIDRAGTGFDLIGLGDLRGGRETLRAQLFPWLGPPGAEAELPDGFPADFPTGWRVVAIVAANGGPSAAIGSHQGERQEADVRFLDLAGLFDPGESFHLDVSGSHGRQIVRPAAPTDGKVLTAVVSPDLADDVDGEGVLTLSMVGGVELRLRPVAQARYFPTVTDQARGLVVVDVAPLMTALNVDAPGLGQPNELLIRAPDDATADAIAGSLSGEPFPPLNVLNRHVLETVQANDPFALGVVWALVVGALAGLGLSLAGILMAAAARLRDERGDFGELEEQGIVPAALGQLAVLQTSVMVVGSLVIGAAIGLGLGWLAAATIAVTGAGAEPVPPLVLVAPWAAIGGLSLALVAGLALAVALIARRHYAGGLLRGSGR